MREEEKVRDRPSGEEIKCYFKADGLSPLLERTVCVWKNNFKTSLQVWKGKPRGHTQDSLAQWRGQKCFTQEVGWVLRLGCGEEGPENASGVRGGREGWKHLESKVCELLKIHIWKEKQAECVEGWKWGKDPELPGDTLCNCWFVYEAGPVTWETLEVKGQVLAILRAVVITESEWFGVFWTLKLI